VKPVHRKTPHGTHEVLLEVRGLQTDSVRGGLHGLSFQMNKGEILGVAGVERNGQQDLVEALIGTRSVVGEILFHGKAVEGDPAHRRFELQWGLISEDRHHQSLWLDGTVKENFLIGMPSKPDKFTSKIMDEIKRFEIKVGSLSQKVSGLSGGNQQKVIIARETSMRTPKLLIASQPTRGVDIGAIELIHHELVRVQEAGTGVLLLSADLDELMSLSDRILVLNNGRAAAVFGRAEFNRERIGQAMVGEVS
jgi:simple sugar transport system ATP-binding protein